MATLTTDYNVYDPYPPVRAQDMFPLPEPTHAPDIRENWFPHELRPYQQKMFDEIMRGDILQTNVKLPPRFVTTWHRNNIDLEPHSDGCGVTIKKDMTATEVKAMYDCGWFDMEMRTIAHLSKDSNAAAVRDGILKLSAAKLAKYYDYAIHDMLLYGTGQVQWKADTLPLPAEPEPMYGWQAIKQRWFDSQAPIQFDFSKEYATNECSPLIVGADLASEADKNFYAGDQWPARIIQKARQQGKSMLMVLSIKSRRAKAKAKKEAVEKALYDEKYQAQIALKQKEQADRLAKNEVERKARWGGIFRVTKTTKTDGATFYTPEISTSIGWRPLLFKEYKTGGVTDTRAATYGSEYPAVAAIEEAAKAYQKHGATVASIETTRD